MGERNCGTCKYWSEHYSDRGECRRTSPYPSAEGAGIWPSTFAAQGCWEHERVDPLSKFEEVPVSHLDLSVRTMNCLMSTNIRTVADLARAPCSYLKSTPNLGPKTMKEISGALEEVGLRLGM